METNISNKKLFKIVFFKFFTSDIVNAIINIMIPLIISIRCTNFSDDMKWWIGTIGMCILIIAFNIISILAKNVHNKSNKELGLIYKCYDAQTNINNKAAISIFRLNKSINEYILENKPVSRKVFDKIADFQSISFIICQNIHDMLTSEYGKDIKCEVTLMKKCKETIKMLSFSNNDGKTPSSYSKTFNIEDKGIFFINLFEDLNAEISCLHDKKSVINNFKMFKDSAKREKEICQYIGIPIKTNRNEIELLLQIDVSKENVFGKNESQILLFAKNVLYPYAVLLHKSYERDLIFNQYYDMITLFLSNK